MRRLKFRLFSGKMRPGVEPKVGQRYVDDSHPEEPEFTITELPSDEQIAELDNGQWYELRGPEGLLAKLESGVVRPIHESGP